MKKVLAVLTVIVMMAVSIPTVQAASNTYEPDEVGIGITVPAEFTVLTRDMPADMREVADSVVFSTPPQTPAPVEHTKAFVYTDKKTGVTFTVPENWKTGTLSKPRDYIDEIFVSTEEEVITTKTVLVPRNDIPHKEAAVAIACVLVVIALTASAALIIALYKDSKRQKAAAKQASAEETLYCHQCGKQLPLDSEFCPYCGVKMLEEKAISEIRYCRRCGDTLLPDSRFCPKCGTQVIE